MLTDIYEDLGIVYRLGFRGILNLSKTCRNLRKIENADHVWHNVCSDETLPLALPPNTPPSALPAKELQRLTNNAIRLDNNWRSPQPCLRGLHALPSEQGGWSLHDMDLLPGGSLMWTAHHRRAFAQQMRVSVWSLDDVAAPRRVWTADHPGFFRTFAFLQGAAQGDAATIFVAFQDNDNNEYVATYQVSLGADAPAVEAGGEAPAYSMRFCIHMNRLFDFTLIDKVVAYEDQMIVTCDAAGADGDWAVRMFAADLKSNRLRRIDERTIRPLGKFAHVRVWGGYLFLIATPKFKQLLIRVHRAPGARDSKGNSVQEYADFGPTLAKFKLRAPHVCGCEVSPIGVAASGSPEFTVMLSYLRRPCGASLCRILRFAFDTASKTLTLVSASPNKYDGQPSESPKYMAVGPMGRRAVVVDQGHVRNVTVDPRTGAVAMSAPPSVPTEMGGQSLEGINKLAFDEATGRVCAGQLGNTVSILDFA
ncbi:hypothetical protein BC628DRAFT_1418307 [Trametes gibbosa]|nr:hypothetical protein BC628DRAFT_1418307 [Trametes gibbosa]